MLTSWHGTRPQLYYIVTVVIIVVITIILIIIIRILVSIVSIRIVILVIRIITTITKQQLFHVPIRLNTAQAFAPAPCLASF